MPKETRAIVILYTGDRIPTNLEPEIIKTIAPYAYPQGDAPVSLTQLDNKTLAESAAKNATVITIENKPDPIVEAIKFVGTTFKVHLRSNNNLILTLAVHNAITHYEENPHVGKEIVDALKMIANMNLHQKNKYKNELENNNIYSFDINVIREVLKLHNLIA